MLSNGRLELINANGNETVSVVLKRKPIKIGSNIVRDVSLTEFQDLHSEITVDSFRRVYIKNYDKNPIFIDGIPLKKKRLLFRDCNIQICSKKFKWTSKVKTPNKKGSGQSFPAMSEMRRVKNVEKKADIRKRRLTFHELELPESMAELSNNEFEIKENVSPFNLNTENSPKVMNSMPVTPKTPSNPSTSHNLQEKNQNKTPVVLRTTTLLRSAIKRTANSPLKATPKKVLNETPKSVNSTSKSMRKATPKNVKSTPISVLNATPKSVQKSTLRSVLNATPKSVKSTPIKVLNATPKSVKSTPIKVLNATPISVLTATPNYPLNTTPKNVPTATPKSALKATPKKVLTATPKIVHLSLKKQTPINSPRIGSATKMRSTAKSNQTLSTIERVPQKSPNTSILQTNPAKESYSTTKKINRLTFIKEDSTFEVPVIDSQVNDTLNSIQLEQNNLANISGICEFSESSSNETANDNINQEKVIEVKTEDLSIISDSDYKNEIVEISTEANNEVHSTMEKQDEVETINKITKTPHKADYSDVKGMKEMFKTPKTNVVYTSGIRELLRTPSTSNNLDDVRDIKKLMKTPHAADYSDVRGMKELLNTPKENVSYTSGIRELLRTPSTSNNLDDVRDIKKLMKTPHAVDYSDVRGMKELLNTPKENVSYTSGIRELMKTPCTDDGESDDYRGVKALMKTPFEPDLRDVKGVKELMNTPKANVLFTSGIRELMKTPVSCDKSYDVCGLKEMLKTPHEIDYGNVQGVKELMNTPKMNVTRVSGIRELLKTPATTRKCIEVIQVPVQDEVLDASEKEKVLDTNELVKQEDILEAVIEEDPEVSKVEEMLMEKVSEISRKVDHSNDKLEDEIFNTPNTTTNNSSIFGSMKMKKMSLNGNLIKTIDEDKNLVHKEQEYLNNFSTSTPNGKTIDLLTDSNRKRLRIKTESAETSTRSLRIRSKLNPSKSDNSRSEINVNNILLEKNDSELKRNLRRGLRERKPRNNSETSEMVHLTINIDKSTQSRSNVHDEIDQSKNVNEIKKSRTRKNVKSKEIVQNETDHKKTRARPKTNLELLKENQKEIEEESELKIEEKSELKIEESRKISVKSTKSQDKSMVTSSDKLKNIDETETEKTELPKTRSTRLRLKTTTEDKHEHSMSVVPKQTRRRAKKIEETLESIKVEGENERNNDETEESQYNDKSEKKRKRNQTKKKIEKLEKVEIMENVEDDTEKLEKESDVKIVVNTNDKKKTRGRRNIEKKHEDVSEKENRPIQVSMEKNDVKDSQLDHQSTKKTTKSIKFDSTEKTDTDADQLVDIKKTVKEAKKTTRGKNAVMSQDLGNVRVTRSRSKI